MNLNKLTIFLIIFYLLTFVCVGTYMFVGYHLEEPIYFHPMISIFIRILLFFDTVIIPIILLLKYAFKEDRNLLSRVVKKLLSTIGISLCSIIIIGVFLFFFERRCIFGLYTENIIFHQDSIVVEQGVWLDNNHISIYKKENIFFVSFIEDFEMKD